MRELERAVHHGIQILPFRIEDVLPTKSMEYFLSSPHWLNAIAPPLEPHIRQMVSTTKLLLSDDPGASPVPAPEPDPEEQFEEVLPDDWSRPKGRIGRFFNSLTDDG
jgi:hypothetical protein